MTEPREFDCEDCGIHVVQLIPFDSTVCAKCHWLRGVEDPEEREEFREFLHQENKP